MAPIGIRDSKPGLGSGSPTERLSIILAPSAFYPHIGGIEELTRQLALELRSRGHEVSVLTNRWPEGARRFDVVDGIGVTRLRFAMPAASPLAATRFLAALPTTAVELAVHLRRLKPDVVHAIGAGPQAAYLEAMARLLRVPLVFTAQGELGFDAHNIFGRSATLRAALRRVLRTAAAVTACSQFVLDELTAFSPITASAVVVPNGVDPEDFSRPARPSHERPYILGVGRLVTQKGFDVLVEALAAGELASLELVIAGVGPERDSLERLARHMGVSSRVRLVGAADRSRLSDLFEGASAFAFPSRGEPFGIALLEAMAAGVPSVATRTGGIVEFARDEENALLVPADDPTALAAALARICSDEPLRRQLADGGKATANALSWSSIASEYERLYARVVAPVARDR